MYNKLTPDPRAVRIVTSVSFHKPFLRCMTRNESLQAKIFYITEFLQMPFHPISCPTYGVSYPLYHRSSRITPARNPSEDPQVAEQRLNFSVCVSEWKRDFFFFFIVLFFSITPSLPLDGKCRGLRGVG